jgi:hypothetical protein
VYTHSLVYAKEKRRRETKGERKKIEGDYEMNKMKRRKVGK